MEEKKGIIVYTCSLVPRYNFLDRTAQVVWIFSPEQLHGTSL